MSVENLKDIFNSEIHRKAIKRGVSYIWREKVTQRESQLKESLLKLIYALYKNKKLNKSQIKRITGLHWNSVMRVCEVAEKKQIVTVRQYNDKKNNEKFYFLKKNRAIIYIHHLFDNNPQKLKEQRQFIESVRTLLDKAPKDFIKSYLYIDDDAKKKIGIKGTKNQYSVKEVLGSTYTIVENDPKESQLYLNKLILLKKILQCVLNGSYCEECIETLPSITKCVRCNNPNCHIINCKNCKNIFDKKKMEKFPLIPLNRFLSDGENDNYERCIRCGYVRQISFIPPKIRGKKLPNLGTLESDKSYSDIRKTKESLKFR